MSTIYKNLTDEDLRIEKESLKNFEKQVESKIKGMTTGFKAIIIGGFILSLGSVIGSGYLYKVINEEKREREALEVSQIQLRQKSNSFEISSQKDRVELISLKERLAKYSIVREDLTRQITQNQKELKEFQAKLKEIEEKTEAINSAADKIQTESQSQPMGPAFAAPSVAPQNISSAQAGAKVPSAAPSAKNYQVLTVNRKFNFVVVNVGLKDNLKIGDVLQVQQGNKNVAQVTVEKIYDNFAAATIVKETQSGAIKEGDRISKA